MSKEKEKKRNVLKSRFFLKLFAIPSICFLLLELWAKTIPNEDGTFTTWAETLQETFIVIITWFILSIIIALIIRKKNKGKNKEEKNTNIIKSNFFLKLFIFPSICWLQLELWLKDTPKDDGTLTTWPELFREVFVIVAVWFIISYIISVIVNETKKDKPKEKTTKEVQYLAKQEDRIIIKPENKEEIIKDLTDSKEEKKVEEIEKINKKKNNKCLYSCESIIDAKEYKIGAKYILPKNYYWAFVIRGTIINLILTAIISIIFRNQTISLLFFVCCEIYTIIIKKVRIGHYTERLYNHNKKRGLIEDSTIYTKFYDNYFTRQKKNRVLKFNYEDIYSFIETDTNFYLKTKNNDITIFIQKDRCSSELIEFIRERFKNIKNNIEDNSNNSSIENLLTILFIATICCIWLSTWSISFINKINPQHGLNIIKNNWIAWCFLPIPIASILLGFKYYDKGYKCAKNIIAGLIMGFILISLGGLCLIPTYSEDYKKINDYKDYIDANIPNNGELEIKKLYKYIDNDKTEYVIINAYYDKENTEELLNSINKSENWIQSTKIKSNHKILLPMEFKIKEDVYYSIYNKTTGEYNTIPNESGNYEIYAMYYDESLKQLTIHNYKYSYVK